MEIRKISSISPKFGPISTLLSKYPLFNTWLASGQIYECDYVKLASVVGIPLPPPDNSILAYPQNPNPGLQQRYMCAPYVLFAHVIEQNISKIVPIAIQLGQTYIAGITAVLYRVDYKDSNGAPLPGVPQGDWTYAKMIVNTADSTLHQLNSHLTKQHLVMENVIIATHVNLPQSHIISRLVAGAGHGLKTLQINEDGRNAMIPGQHKHKHLTVVSNVADMYVVVHIDVL